MRRVATENNIHREVVMTTDQDRNGVTLPQEVEDPVLTCNTDRVGTARSRKKWVSSLLLPVHAQSCTLIVVFQESSRGARHAERNARRACTQSHSNRGHNTQRNRDVTKTR